MLIKLVNWLRGYLIVQIRGISPERFINLCSYKKIFIWDISNKADIYQFKITVKNFKNLKPIIKKTGIVPRINQKRGFPFFLYRNRKRKGFFIGGFICILLVYIMSFFIWNISILGGSKYTPEAMVKFLNDNKVYTGILKKKVDCQEIEETIRLAYKDIGWVSAEIKGTRLIIKITETNMPAPAEIAIAPSHMIATKDAIVQKIITRTGTPMVKPGDVIKKGDILVSGIITIKGDFEDILDLKPVIASADILCKSYYDYHEEFSMDYIKKIFTDEKKKGYYFTLLGKKIFLYNPSNSYNRYDIIVEENTLHITDTFYLPLRYGTVTAREYVQKESTYSQDEAIAIAKARLKRYLDRLIENNVLIIENNVTISIENNTCIAKGRIIVEEPAWEYKIVDESEWRIEQPDEHNGDNN
ncbi:sporulation protein YqfD [Mobilitalea sibirica]|uniref:Sporulation protein YqfD n=1 Tax=Mobilitalea sibirica TaxID=1462919 RepID=A0A8J7GZS2_9FIRM|nr:sporulation protein YqfD [Mobilitalea sibirica]MBH1941454.1 sporulation protein YqfD [Mobilitalea sibirica]